MTPTKSHLGSRRPNPIAAPRLNRSQIARRRSSRIALDAPVELSGEDRKKTYFATSAKATNLNKHGAAIQVNRELTVGAVLIVRNKRGKEVPARVAAQLSAVDGVPAYGIEFTEQDDQTNSFLGDHFSLERLTASWLRRQSAENLEAI